jgi:hypothetical protein
MTAIDQVIEILEKSDDGDKLTPRDLKLTEIAANGWLSEAGEVALTKLYRMVVDGSYFTGANWFHGIEHLTQDHEGYVLWKNRCVEHYSFKDGDSERAAALSLAECCRKLEANGIPVSGRTATSAACYDAPADTQWKKALASYYSFFTRGDIMMAVFVRGGTKPEEDSCFSVENVNGLTTVVPFPGVYEAFHAVIATGAKALEPSDSFTQVEERLLRLNIPASEIDSLIDFYVEGATEA